MVRTRARSTRTWLSRGLVGLAVAALLVLLVYGLTTRGSNAAIDQSLSEGEAPAGPGFELPVLEYGSPSAAMQARTRPALADGRLSLDELRGTPVVLNFWASWCVPCREEAPRLEAAWRRFGDQTLFVGLNMQDIRQDARDFLAEFGVTYPTIREQDDETAREYGAIGIPETYFISARGRVVGHVIGVVSEAQLVQGVRAAVTGEVAGTKGGGARRPQR